MSDQPMDNLRPPRPALDLHLEDITDNPALPGQPVPEEPPNALQHTQEPPQQPDTPPPTPDTSKSPQRRQKRSKRIQQTGRYEGAGRQTTVLLPPDVRSRAHDLAQRDELTHAELIFRSLHRHHDAVATRAVDNVDDAWRDLLPSSNRRRPAGTGGIQFTFTAPDAARELLTERAESVKLSVSAYVTQLLTAALNADERQ